MAAHEEPAPAPQVPVAVPAPVPAPVPAAIGAGPLVADLGAVRGSGLGPLRTPKQVLALQRIAGNRAVTRLAAGRLLQRNGENASVPHEEPNASMPEPNKSEEAAYEFSWQGQKYRIPESQWPAFQAEAAQKLAAMAAPDIRLRLQNAEETYASFQALEDENYIGPFLIHTVAAAPRIEEYLPYLDNARVAAAGVANAAGTGDLAATCAALQEAQARINDALNGVQDYLARVNMTGEVTIVVMEFVQGAAFAAFSVALGAVLVPAGAAAATVAVGGGASAGATAFLQGTINVAADAAVGPNTNTRNENLDAILISSALNAAGGAAGSVIAAQIKGPVIAELVRLHKSELAHLSDAVLQQVVVRATEGFAGGLSNIVQGVLADIGAALLTDMTFEQFERRVVANMLANGIGGAIMGAATAHPARPGAPFTPGAPDAPAAPAAPGAPAAPVAPAAAPAAPAAAPAAP